MVGKPGYEELERQIQELETELERVNRDFARLKDRYDRAENLANFGYWIRDLNDSAATWSDGICSIFGVAPNDVPQSFDSFLSLLHPSDRQHLKNQITEAMMENDTLDVEYRLIRPDGEERYVRSIGEICLGPRGQRTIEGVIVDITESKQTQSYLEKTQVILSEAEKLTGIGGWEWDVRADIWHVSTNWQRIHGCSDRPLTTSELLPFAHPEDIPKIREAFSRALVNGDSYKLEHRIIRQDTGEVRYIKSYGSVQHDASGKVVKLFGAACDVTERRQSEDALRRSEERYRKLAENSPAVVFQFMMSSQGEFVFPYVSEGVSETMGVSAKEVMDDSNKLLGMIHPDDLQAFREGVEESAESLKQYHKVIRYLRGGRSRWIECWSTPECNEDGSIVWSGFFVDITDRKRAEDELEEAVLRQKEAVKAGNVGLWDWDLVTNKVHYSTEWKKQIGFEEDEVDDDYEEWRSRIHPDDLKSTLEITQKSIAEGRQNHKTEFRFRHRDGSYRWIMVQASILKDEKGRPVRMLGSHVDVTERKQAEKALAKQRKRFEQILDSFPYGIYIVDKNFCIEYANRSIRMEFGDPANLKCYEYFHALPNACPWCQNDKVFQGETVQWEWTSPKNDRHYELIDVPLENEDGSISKLEVFHDVTERKLAEQERAKLEAQLRQVQKMEAIGALAGGIAHDFNNALGIILGNIEMAADDIPQASSAHFSLSEARQACFRVKDMVHQILAFSRQEEREFETIDIQPVVKEAVKMLRSSIPATIEIREEISTEDAFILGDPTQIHQVLMNLCSNAADAMEKTNSVLQVCLDSVDLDAHGVEGLPGLLPGRHIQLTVSDTGHGIAPEILDKIFDPYFTTRETGSGTGMGLAVVHGIIKKHGGIITVDSEPGRGTTFYVFFPEIDCESEDQCQTAKPTPRGTETILFVDDEAQLVNVGQRMLEGLGYVVETKTSSVEALETFRMHSDRYDVVITDMTMPGMTGETLAKELMELQPDTPIILCTGFSHKMDEEKAKSIGIKGFVMKPLVKAEIANAIRSVLDEKYG